jgi:hypothetical protein
MPDCIGATVEFTGLDLLIPFPPQGGRGPEPGPTASAATWTSVGHPGRFAPTNFEIRQNAWSARRFARVGMVCRADLRTSVRERTRSVVGRMVRSRSHGLQRPSTGPYRRETPALG